MTDLYNIVMGRKSVRTYDGNGLREEDKGKILEFIQKIDTPFGVPVTFTLLDAKEYGLSSPVLTGEKLFIAAKVDKTAHAEEAFGFAFERLILYAWSLGIGTVWIGGTMNRAAFEKAMSLKENEMMPCVSPLGYPAAKRSIREVMMRKGVKADDRKPSKELFFDGSLDTPLSVQSMGEISDLFEMVRWAPSAVNKQPWRIIVKDGMYHFYEKKDKGYISDATGDLQKIDVGIALCHFMLGLEEHAFKPEVVIEDPGIVVTMDMEYIASVKC